MKSCYDPPTETIYAYHSNCPIFIRSLNITNTTEWLNINQQNAKNCNKYLYDIYIKFNRYRYNKKT